MAAAKFAIILIFITLHIHPAHSQKNNDLFSENSRARDSILARDIAFKGVVLGREGKHQEALDTLFLSLELRKKLYGQEDYNLAAVYSAIGISYRNLGQYDNALKYLTLAENNYMLSDRFSLTSKTRLYSNIGNVYINKLNYGKALQYFNQTLTLQQNNQGFSPADIAGTNYKIAEVYYRIKEEEKALEIINANVDHAYVEDKILYNELLAFINQLKGNLVAAKKSYQKVIVLSNEYYGEDNLFTGIEYLNYAYFLISSDEFSEAREILDRAYRIIRLTQPEYGMDLAYYFNLYGELFRKKSIATRNFEEFASQKYKNLLEALVWYEKGLKALNFRVPYDESILADSDRWISVIDCIELLKEIADTHGEIALTLKNEEKENELPSLMNAIENYKIAGNIINKARKEITGDESKIQLTELELATFYKLIETAHRAYEISDNEQFINLAFQSTERTKSSSVFDRISNELALENSIIPDSLIQLGEKLNNTIAIYSEKLYEEKSVENPDTALINEYSTTVFNTGKERESLNRYLEENYSDYYNLKYSDSMLTVTQIQKKLKEDEVILEYTLNEEDTVPSLYTFVISRKDIEFHKQQLDNHFMGALASVFKFMSGEYYLFTTHEESKSFCDASHFLYLKLVYPHSSLIRNKNLIVIPDGKLSYIPFDGLLQELPDTSSTIQFNRLNYLIRNYSVNYANSSNILFNLHSPVQSFKNKVVAFAPEYHEEKIEVASVNYTLLPLPGVQKEVQMISEAVRTRVFRGEEASEANFRDHIGDADILHLAMHAFINDSIPAFSKLAFAQLPGENELADGLINTADIYNLNLNAQLAVLSACNTGSGKLRKGEGIMSLARGFFYAGCPSLIMSLWEVEDQSGTTIMTSFYKNLKKGYTKDKALRLAKLQYLDNSNSRRAHPHYWLGYINMGDRSPLYQSYDFYFFALLILLIIGVVTDQVYRIKKARKKRAF